MTTLHLSVKREYFEQIKAGTKTEEYRLFNEYWWNRLYQCKEMSYPVERKFSGIEISLGYPKATDTSRRIIFPWRGFMIKTITHPHFGPKPVQVFAIKLGRRQRQRGNKRDRWNEPSDEQPQPR